MKKVFTKIVIAGIVVVCLAGLAIFAGFQLNAKNKSAPRQPGLLSAQQMPWWDKVINYFRADLSGFNVIPISGANELDQNKKIIADLYPLVGHQDQKYAQIPAGHYIRAIFERKLTRQNDIKIYAKGDGTIQVFKKNSKALITTFNIKGENWYGNLLTAMSGETDSFDLKFSGDIWVDYIVDPTPASVTDDFSDSTKIASSSSVTVSGGQVTLASTGTWTCGDTLTDSRDSKTYTTVLIGAQCWMRQNINVGTLTAGANTQGTDCPSAAEIEKYCYSDDENNCDSNGGLYQWNQAMCGSTDAGAQGICPTGWHIPTHDEYTTLELAVCTSGSCATDFPYDASTTSWRGTNEGTTLKTVSATKFSGLLAGYRNTNGTFSNVGTIGYFWTSLPAGANAWVRSLVSSVATVYRTTDGKAYGFSVRCLKN